MQLSTRTISATEHEFLDRIDAAVRLAGDRLELADVADEDEDTIWEIHEMRHHCGVCTTREVMETVWPEIEAYVDWMADRADAAEKALVEERFLRLAGQDS